MTKEMQPEALRLAECLERDTKMNWPDYDNQVGAAAELRRLHARVQELKKELATERCLSFRAQVEQLEAQLVTEAARAAAEKRRADQMTEQHRMQADMHANAREQLAKAQRKPLTDEQISDALSGIARWQFPAESRSKDYDRAAARAIERAHGIGEVA